MDTFVLDASKNIKFKKKLDYLQPYFGVSSYMTAIYPNFATPYTIIDDKNNPVGNWLIWSINENPNDSGCKNIINDDGSKILEVRSSDYKPNPELDKNCPEPDIRLVFSKLKGENLWVFRGAFKALYKQPILKNGKYVNAYSRVSSKVRIIGKHPNIKLSLDTNLDNKELISYKVPEISKLYEDLTSKDNFVKDNKKLTVPIGVEEVFDQKGNLIKEKPIFLDLANIPHMLISGTTGSGKTLFTQSMLVSMINAYSIDDFEIIIYDSKSIDYSEFNGTRRLLIPIMSNAKKIHSFLGWLDAEINKRIEKTYIRENYPHLFVILDDFAQAELDDEARQNLINILLRGNRSKVHVWFITSSPNTKCIPNEIKSCIPCRISFTSATSRESRLVLDEPGAESLAFPGKYIIKSFGEKHICYAPVISSEQIEKCLIEDKLSTSIDYDINILLEIERKAACSSINIQEEELDLDPLFYDAAEKVIAEGKAATTLLQKKLKIGYARAARIIDELEENGIIGPSQGAQPREVLLTKEEFSKRRAIIESKQNLKEKSTAENNQLEIEREDSENFEEFSMPIITLPDEVKDYSQVNEVNDCNGINSSKKAIKNNCLSSFFRKIFKHKEDENTISQNDEIDSYFR